jgi:hypothetical protein
MLILGIEPGSNNSHTDGLPTELGSVLFFRNLNNVHTRLQYHRDNHTLLVQITQGFRGQPFPTSQILVPPCKKQSNPNM